MAFSLRTLGPLGPLARHRDFVHLWAAQSVSAFGSRITRTALPVIAILLVTADPVQLAILGALEVIPGVVVGLLAGGFIDRHAKRPVLVWSDIARAVLVFSIPLAAWVGHLGIEQLYVVAALVGGFSALFRLADNAYLPVLIGREHLVDGNSKLQATDSVAEIGGPGLAGVLIQFLTAPITMVIDAFSYVFSAVLLGRIRAAEPPQTVSVATPTLIEDVRIGARAGFGHPIVGPTFWSFAVGDLANGFFMALYMLYALQTLAIDVATIGIVISLGGISALAGAFVASAVSRAFGLGRAMILTLAIGKMAGMFVAFASVEPRFAVAMPVGQSTARRRRDGCVPDTREQLSPGGAAARRDGAREWPAAGDDRRADAARCIDRRAARKSDFGDVRRLDRLSHRAFCRCAAVARAHRCADHVRVARAGSVRADLTFRRFPPSHRRTMRASKLAMVFISHDSNRQRAAFPSGEDADASERR